MDKIKRKIIKVTPKPEGIKSFLVLLLVRCKRHIRFWFKMAWPEPFQNFLNDEFIKKLCKMLRKP